MSEELDPKRGLVIKLCEVMEAVDRIPKRGENEHFHYKFATEGDVSDTIRKELAKRHIWFTSAITSVTTVGNLTTIETRHTFVDGDSGERESFYWSSQGQDTQDKGVSKAATSAIKYALLKAFLVPTGDDPDEAPPVDRGAPRTTATSRQEPSQAPLVQAAQRFMAKSNEQNGGDTQTEKPYYQQKFSEASPKALAWFNGKILKEKYGLDHDDALRLLGIASFKQDRPDHTLGQVSDELARELKNVG